MKLEEMKKSALFAYLATHPYARVVQIADAVDMDIGEVEDELLPHVNRGHLIKKDVLAPNQRWVPGYAFSDDFRKTDVYQALLGDDAQRRAELPPEQKVVFPVASAPAPGTTATDAAADAAPASKQSAPLATGAKSPPRWEVVAEYIHANGPVNAAKVRELLNLKAGEHASTVLASATRLGRLIKVGDAWQLGRSVDDLAVAPLPGASAQHSAQPGGAFRCGRWSDGAVELQRGGQQLTVLSESECRVIAQMFAPVAV